jgi:hypothetical protein
MNTCRTIVSPSARSGSRWVALGGSRILSVEFGRSARGSTWGRVASLLMPRPNPVQDPADDNAQPYWFSPFVTAALHAENMAWSSGGDEQSEG